MSWELMSYGELMSGGTNVLDSLNTLHRSTGPRGSAGTRLHTGPSGLLDFVFYALDKILSYSV